MLANRQDTIVIDGKVFDIHYVEGTVNAFLKERGGDTRYDLAPVEGQYVLETPQRRDLVINELLSIVDRKNTITAQDLLRFGFRASTEGEVPAQSAIDSEGTDDFWVEDGTDK